MTLITKTYKIATIYFGFILSLASGHISIGFGMSIAA